MCFILLEKIKKRKTKARFGGINKFSSKWKKPGAFSVIEEDTNEPPSSVRFRLRDQKVSGCGFSWPATPLFVCVCVCGSFLFVVVSGGREFVKEGENELL